MTHKSFGLSFLENVSRSFFLFHVSLTFIACYDKQKKMENKLQKWKNRDREEKVKHADIENGCRSFSGVVFRNKWIDRE